eukprot:TRINITY_DN683_c0_g1_i1.p1 TRINITY_DN683_c0_g1~~TRINITY_DN683_c0_g1_i1.p1  ORF type:complete len:778 (+),score=189.67 TRINITY_DN683_c0_g1_i1:179-2512(+)
MFGRSSYQVKLVAKSGYPLHLSAICRNESNAGSLSLFNLDEHVGFQNGKLVWGGCGISCFKGSKISIYNTLRPGWSFSVEEMNDEEEKLLNPSLKESSYHPHRFLSRNDEENHNSLRGEMNRLLNEGLQGEWMLEVEVFGLSKATLNIDINIENLGGKMVAARSRTLMVCLDGTNNEFGERNTNVIRLMSCLVKDDPNKQEVYYQTGIGTYGPPGAFSNIRQGVDGMIAVYLGTHVMDAYRFICSRYRAGDHICLFGFSRGAYIARAVAGFIHMCGLLPANNLEHVSFAYKLYESEDEKQCAYFKDTFSFHVKIQFLGVWDTVASVGTLYSRYLPATQDNPSVKHFRHALAMDECRTRFKHLSWDRSEEAQHKWVSGMLQFPLFKTILAKEKPKDKKKEEDEEGLDKSADEKTVKKEEDSLIEKLLYQKHELPSFIRENNKYSFEESITNHIKYERSNYSKKEVWFAGNHCDVGGGNTNNGSMKSLSYISFRWMVGECLSDETSTGILFDYEKLEEYRVPVKMDKYGKITLKSKLAWKFDKIDATLSFMHNELDAVFPWWLLEMGGNFGTGREIYPTSEGKISIHQSALYRSKNQKSEISGGLGSMFLRSQELQGYQLAYSEDMKNFHRVLHRVGVLDAYSSYYTQKIACLDRMFGVRTRTSLLIARLWPEKISYVRKAIFKEDHLDQFEYIRSGANVRKEIIGMCKKLQLILQDTKISAIDSHILLPFGELPSGVPFNLGVCTCSNSQNPSRCTCTRVLKESNEIQEGCESDRDSS